jgi:hypothetical protein
MAATFANPIETDVPIVFDSNAGNGLGFATQGIGLRGADHASVDASRIGSAPDTDHKFDTDRNPAA